MSMVPVRKGGDRMTEQRRRGGWQEGKRGGRRGIGGLPDAGRSVYAGQREHVDVGDV